jgi:hypothetical protein
MVDGVITGTLNANDLSFLNLIFNGLFAAQAFNAVDGPMRLAVANSGNQRG